MRATVTQARQWANDLVRREVRGPGDTANAMRRLEARTGIPWRVFWGLRYRPPSDLWASVHERLRAAYLAECERQMRKLEHDIEITKAVAGPDNDAVREAAAALDAARRAVRQKR